MVRSKPWTENENSGRRNPIPAILKYVLSGLGRDQKFEEKKNMKDCDKMETEIRA